MENKRYELAKHAPRASLDTAIMLQALGMLVITRYNWIKGEDGAPTLAYHWEDGELLAYAPTLYDAAAYLRKEWQIHIHMLTTTSGDWCAVPVQLKPKTGFMGAMLDVKEQEFCKQPTYEAALDWGIMHACAGLLCNESASRKQLTGKASN